MHVAELNSASAEQRITIRKDAREAFFFSDRPGSAVTDLWTSSREDRDAVWGRPTLLSINSAGTDAQPTLSRDGRSEERRVGKECRSRWSPYHGEKKGCEEVR